MTTYQLLTLLFGGLGSTVIGVYLARRLERRAEKTSQQKSVYPPRLATVYARSSVPSEARTAFSVHSAPAKAPTYTGSLVRDITGSTGYWERLAVEIRTATERGQPVLAQVGSDGDAELFSKLLKAYRVPHVVYSSRYVRSRDRIVAQAGRKGAVTVTPRLISPSEVIIGGDPIGLANSWLPPGGLGEVKSCCSEERAIVEAAGGLLTLAIPPRNIGRS
jgi:hypothetical protein